MCIDCGYSIPDEDELNEISSIYNTEPEEEAEERYPQREYIPESYQREEMPDKMPYGYADPSEKYIPKVAVIPDPVQNNAVHTGNQSGYIPYQPNSTGAGASQSGNTGYVQSGSNPQGYVQNGYNGNVQSGYNGNVQNGSPMSKTGSTDYDPTANFTPYQNVPTVNSKPNIFSNLKASDLKWGELLASFFIPFVGFILGIKNLSKTGGTDKDKATGIICLGLAVLGLFL